MKVAFAFFALCAAITAGFTSYEGYKIFNIYPANEQELIIVKKFEGNDSFNFWSAPRQIGLLTTVIVTPELQYHFINVLQENRIQYSVLNENVESIIAAERFRQSTATKDSGATISFTKYNRYNEIQTYLTQLAQNYPNMVSLENIGKSYEYRNMTLIKIGTGGTDKPIIFIDGGAHAREWITPAVATYIIRELVENVDNRNLIENTDWYILPVLNPDGYEHTHTEGGDRFWRKTRSRNDEACVGVDPNRNFDFHWNEIGSSPNPCYETYAGPNAFSEPETSALRDVVIANKDRIKLYLSLHSYGNLILYPWGYYTPTVPDNVDELDTLGRKVAAAIEATNGTIYRVECVSDFSVSSGNSIDWAKGMAGVELSYALELPGSGEGGFALPASRILGVSKETFEGVKVYQNYIAKKFGIPN